MIPLFKPYMPEQLPELDKILHSGALAFGKYGHEFERGLKQYVGVEQITLVNSFNSAILVALATLGVKSGDEVIASPMACLASNQPFITTGAKVIWADVCPKTGTLDPDSVRKKITTRTKVIFHNHYCGFPGYIDEINTIGKELGIPIVDDAIEAFGSEYKGQKIGNTGTDLTIFSFQAVRLPTTVDGGAIVFKDKYLYEKSLRVRDSGIDRRYFRDDLGEINSTYDITISGFGATMSDVNSYIGIQQLKDIQELISRQRKNAEGWDLILADKHPTFIPLNKRKEIVPNYWVYGMLVENKSEVLKEFRKMGYYASGVHFPNNHYSVFGKHEEMQGVSEFYLKFLALPSGWWFSI